MADELERYAAGWTMAGVMADLRADGLTGAALATAVNAVAADLEAAGYPMLTVAEIATLTLSTADSASSYGVPVLVIDGAAYGPSDMTPAGVTAADLLRAWAERFLGPGGLDR